jgi:hypothetical protein
VSEEIFLQVEQVINEVQIEQIVNEIEIAYPGPPGPPGPSGTAGGSQTFTFNTPSTSWPVSHNYDRDPISILVFVNEEDVTGETLITLIDSNNFTVDFGSTPEVGRVVVS